MIRAFAVADVRAAEAVRLAQVPEGALMQRAAAGLAAVCAQVLRARRGAVTASRVVLLVGAGNNGGDALWAGERLARRGARVDAVLLARSVHAEGLAALRAAGGRVLNVSDGGGPDGGGPDGGGPDGGGPDGGGLLAVATGLLARADLVLDGLVGLGGSPGLREPAATLVAGLAAGWRSGSRAALVAVDLPSGVDPDTGATPSAHVRADVTVTFGAAKPCLLLRPASAAAGRVVVVDLGLGPDLPAVAAVDRLEDADAGRLWPVPGPDDDKYSRGVVGVVAGSQAYTGAAVLAVGGALRAGAGMVRYLGPPHPTAQVRARWPEVVVGPGRVQAWVLGSGVDPAPDLADGQAGLIREAIASGLPCVVDAGALDLVLTGPGEQLAAHHLLTPHAGELARLLTRLLARPGPDEIVRADVEARPFEHAVRAAAATGATVLLKGSTTVLAGPDGRVRSQADGPPWLATAGAGDVLAGIAGALLAAGLDPLDAGGLAALVHGRAASLAGAGGPVIAEDVAAAVPRAVAALLARAGSGDLPTARPAADRGSGPPATLAP